MAVLAQVRDFLSRRRLAVVGVSRNPNDFSRSLFRELERRGYDLVPVNPGVAEMEGRRCFARVDEVSPPVEAALLLTPPALTGEVVRDCAKAGVASVWMYRTAPDAVSFCESQGILVVAGECPWMFLPDAGFPHRLHGFVRRIVGSYPR